MNSRKAKSSEVTIDHTVTLNMGISEMLDAFNLGSAFDELISKFTNAYEMQEGAGAPSKAHTRQLVQIQHEERLAATSELNPTPGLVTGRCDAGGKGYQAAI